ncbi:MAG: hypothetical protein J3K34DRAFT_129281 [Monoraphidium minutum]|nr:MAG: hypothetical protein J3K34DRAFT_129281 [Monoraphidium minutum]
MLSASSSSGLCAGGAARRRGGHASGARGPTRARAGAGGVAREVLSSGQRAKLDPSLDRDFYAFPRLVKHVDDGFLAQVTQLYRQRIPEDAVVLDLCSSWVSHLPKDRKYKEVVGHGMNAQELAKNPQLDRWFVRDLNKEPGEWALGDASVDAVVCCVSVQYLQRPEAVFAEVYRVLKPGGVAMFTFSNRMFYDKAISAWRDGTGYSRCQLVKEYFQCVPGFTTPEVLLEVKAPGGAAPPAGGGGPLAALLRPLAALLQRGGSDPFYAVVAYRNFRREDA